MPRLILDEFTHLPISAQRKWQLRNAAAGLCRICGAVADGSPEYCKDHYAAQQNYKRKASSRLPLARTKGRKAQRVFVRTFAAVPIQDIL